MSTTAIILIASGFATRYNPGVMAEVISNRAGWGQIPADTEPARAIALLDCEYLGQTVWLETPDALIVQAVVADCAAAQHREQLALNGFAVDLSYELARRLNVMDGPMAGFRVWSQRPQGTISRR